MSITSGALAGISPQRVDASQHLAHAGRVGVFRQCARAGSRRDFLPRRLVRAEKSLYDTGQRLRTAVETNREEKVSRKEVTEISTGNNGALTVAAPYERDGEVVGYVDVAIQPPLKAQKPSLVLPLVVSISALAGSRCRHSARIGRVTSPWPFEMSVSPAEKSFERSRICSNEPPG